MNLSNFYPRLFLYDLVVHPAAKGLIIGVVPQRAHREMGQKKSLATLLYPLQCFLPPIFFNWRHGPTACPSVTCALSALISA